MRDVTQQPVASRLKAGLMTLLTCDLMQPFEGNSNMNFFYNNYNNLIMKFQKYMKRAMFRVDLLTHTV